MKILRFDYDSIDSTNAEARRFWSRPEIRRQAREAHSEGRRLAWAFVAREQTAGRGRLGRYWMSPRGGLWFTVLWPLAAADLAHAQRVPLVAGLALFEAIEKRWTGQCRIKWPNDVLVGERKISGILCELEAQAEISAVIIGIGINANFRSSELSSDFSFPGTTLLDESGVETDLEGLLRDVLEDLSRKLLAFESAGLTPFVPLINARLAWANSRVTVAGSEAGDVTGVLRGIDERGRVVIECAETLLSLLSGEVRTPID